MKQLISTLCFMLFMVGMTIAQRSISGTVTGSDGEALIGASVRVKGTTRGTVTDLNGRYTVEAPNGANAIIVSYTGFATQEVALGASNAVDVTLAEGTVLEETVVTALGFEAQKGKVGVASSRINGSQVTSSATPSVLNSLAGKAAGVNIVASSGDPGAGSRIVIRGVNSVTGDVQPLIVIDGVPMFNESQYGQGSSATGNNGGVTQQSRFNDLNPDDIASVDVLRGASAAALWGTRALGGVIVITTKKGKVGTKKDWTVSLNSSVAFDQVNKEHELQYDYGQGRNMKYQFAPTGGRSWGDRIANRPGTADEFITDPAASGYNGYFEDASGNRFYNIANGTNTDLNGGKNSRSVYSPYDMFFKTGTTFNNSVSISNATESGSTYLSLSNVAQDGVIRTNSNYGKTTATLGLVRNLGTKITVEGNVNYSYTNSDRIQMGSNLNGLFLGGLRNPADYDAATGYSGSYVDKTGVIFSGRQRAYRNGLGAGVSSVYDNPSWMMENITSNAKVNRVISRLEARYYPIEGLSITARGGLDTYGDERSDYFPSISSGANNGGKYTRESLNGRQVNLDVFARYSKEINDNFGFNVLLGNGWNQRVINSHGAFNQGFVNPLAPPALSNSTTYTVFNDYEERRITGTYGTIGFEFFDQFFVNVTGRNDIASTLPAGSNSFFYPAVDAAWQFSKLTGTNGILSSGKLRAGFGKVGREPGPYQINNILFTPGTGNTGYGEGWGPGVSPAAYGGAFVLNHIARNPNIKPEIKTELEGGFDLGFMKDRFTVGFTYYTNEITDAILTVDVPESSGFLQQVTNAGVLQNKGIEIEASFDVISNKDVTWNLYGNFTRNRNKTVSLAGSESVFLSGFTDGSSRAVEGQPIGVLWGSRWDRDPSGNLVLDDNGFPQLAATSGVIGDPNPDFRTGFGTGIRYKGFKANVLFDAAIGGDMWNGTRGALDFFGRTIETGTTTTLTADQAQNLKLYDGSNVATVYPFAANADGSYTVRGSIKNFGGGDVFLDEIYYTVGPGSGFTGPTENYIEDASWTRLREASLSYSFNPSKWGIKGISGGALTLTGRNLLLFTDYKGNDPDQSLNGSGENGFGLEYFNNPSTRTYQIGLNLTF